MVERGGPYTPPRAGQLGSEAALGMLHFISGAWTSWPRTRTTACLVRTSFGRGLAWVRPSRVMTVLRRFGTGDVAGTGRHNAPRIRHTLRGSLDEALAASSTVEGRHAALQVLGRDT